MEGEAAVENAASREYSWWPLAGVLVVLVVFGVVVLARAGGAGGGVGPAMVSLTFDDGTADEYQARSLLASHGMHGVFYVNSGRFGLPGYMTQSQVQDL